MSFCGLRMGRPLVLPPHHLVRVGLSICQLFSRLLPRLILIGVRFALMMGLLDTHHLHAVDLLERLRLQLCLALRAVGKMSSIL